MTEHPLPWIAWRELRAHLPRSLCAGAGIGLAVAAVICSSSLRMSAERRLAEDLAAQGRSVLVLTPGPELQGTARASLLPDAFTADDVAALRREVAGIELLAPATSRLSIVAAGAKARRALVLGTTPDYFALGERALAVGRWMTAEEVTAGAAACVIGPSLRTGLFGAADPLGRSVRVGTLMCQVVGVLSSAAESGATPDPNLLLAMPLVTLERALLGTQHVAAIYIATRADHSTPAVAHQVEMLMRERRRLGTDAPLDFALRDARALLRSPSRAAEVLPLILDGFAAAGFLFGGACIALWLRALVQERRRQLGMGVAMGASRRDIALLVLTQAGLVAALAGLCGIPVGLLLGYVGARLGALPFGVSGLTLVLAPLGSVLVGISFGLWPARSVASQPASELLRHD